MTAAPTTQAVQPRTEPTGVRELSAPRVSSPVPERFRVSVIGGDIQMDVSLPGDALVADLLPYLAGLIAQRESEGQDPATLRGESTERHLLTRERDGERLAPERSLRAAGVRSGDLLHVHTERTLRPPTRYDDVVDAAAQLNRTAYAGWSPASAAVMSCVALYAGVAVLIWMALDGRFAGDRTAVVGIQAGVVVALLSAATAASRFQGARRAAAMFAWAAMPLIAAIAWVVLSPWRPWGAVVACVVVVAASHAAYRLVGAARWGFLAVAVLAGALGIMALGLAAGLDAGSVAAVSTTVLILATGLVPRHRVRRPRAGRDHDRGPDTGRDDVFTDPFGTARDEPPPDVRSTLPTAERVLAQTRAAATVRSALHSGLSAAVVAGIVLLLRSGPEPAWVDLAFAVCCGAALGLRTRFCRSVIERAAPMTGAVAVVMSACAAALSGPTPVAAAGAGVLLLMALGAVRIGLAPAARRDAGVRHALLDYADYIAVGALIPLTLGVIGLYAHLDGIR
ncbi:type VII secretion integral membrane protein EccD [Mycobacterium sp. CPCC 205372]|uniref:Type VII secretion integral membrane protein EccD n=1 Tax=Mycobacterium hippophais TaxID=3016340 RepID=A0ABT4PUJ6_9MYCO|nr:type VII secretion integral membrane protein EccD [Mycobacterium hippophais]MCZ8380188.1 type VII secretion integral membrane protein EccD [Mycobacterium hippophais]